MEIIHKILTAN